MRKRHAQEPDLFNPTGRFVLSNVSNIGIDQGLAQWRQHREEILAVSKFLLTIHYKHAPDGPVVPSNRHRGSD